jgi:hypothetical protein
MADLARDPKNASTYLEIYKTLNPGATKAPLTTAQQTSAMSIRDAAGSIQNYVQQLDQAQQAGVTGFGTGPLNAFLGKTGLGGSNESLAYSIESNRTDLATQLAKATTNGKPSSNQINQWKESLPSIQDSPLSVQNKLNLLMENLNVYYNSATTPIGVASGQ